MKVFLVGGAIRDELLGIPFNEKDWVVINSSHKEMIKKALNKLEKTFQFICIPRQKKNMLWLEKK